MRNHIEVRCPALRKQVVLHLIELISPLIQTVFFRLRFPEKQSERRSRHAFLFQRHASCNFPQPSFSEAFSTV